MEQSSYISREKMYCQYDGRTYYPKYSEDLVHTAVLLPANAPPEYADPSVLWNAVESNEKASNAQLARTYRVELPNEWSYELAKEVMQDYIQRNFVGQGMCVQYAIHDSENKNTGQRNLHCHMLLTMRGFDEKGQWLPKQKKVYLTDENGERIPLIDKQTGQQKVDKQNRKQWKCQTIPTNDWSSKENARKWRKDLTDTINAVNERMGMTENFWEHRSFEEQGLDKIPQIHLGEKSSAMERAGIPTHRGNINRKIIASNLAIEQAKDIYEQTQRTLQAVLEASQKAISNVKNEILETIKGVAERNKNRLSLPIVGNKYIRFISRRETLQNREQAEKFVHDNKLETFEDLKEQKQDLEQTYQQLYKQRKDTTSRMEYLQSLLESYKKYEPYVKYHKEQWQLKGFARKQYERKHKTELMYYDIYREELKGMIQEPDKKIIPKAWNKELGELQKEFEDTKQPYAKTVTSLAMIEMLEYNKKDLARMLENERRAEEKQKTRRKTHGYEKE